MPQFDDDLLDFAGGFETPQGKDYATKAAVLIQMHRDAKRVEASQEAARQGFMDNFNNAKQGLISNVKQDPSSVGLALDLSRLHIEGLTAALGHGAEAHGALMQETQGEIAHAAVQAQAQRHAGAAVGMLNDPKVGGVLPEDQRQALYQYTGQMEQLRQQDAAARQMDVIRQQNNTSAGLARDWLGKMSDPQTGQAWFLDNAAQRIMADDRMSPWDKAGLIKAHGNLLMNGAPSTSDPELVHELMQRAALPHNDPANPTVGEILGHVGGGLTLPDAQFLAGRSGPQDAQTDQATSRVAEVMAQAKGEINNPSAFGRFVSWLLPTVRGGASLDPNSKDYALTPERMEAFKPTGDDVIQPVVGNVDPAARRSLGEIFGPMHVEAGTYNRGTKSDPLTGAFQGLADLPRAVADGAREGWDRVNTMTPAQQDQYAYNRVDQMPIQQRIPPAEHSPTMADMAEIDPKDLELPARSE